MCQNCNNNSCGGCNQQCYQFPPPPGPPGPVGPIGPQGPPGLAPLFNIIEFSPNCILPGICPYACDGTEDVILVYIPITPVPFSVVWIQLLPASNPLMQRRVVRIKDANYRSGTIDIILMPDVFDTVENGLPGIGLSLFSTVGAGGSVTLVANNNNNPNLATGYKIV
jgi:hypothetical protein